MKKPLGKRIGKYGIYTCLFLSSVYFLRFSFQPSWWDGSLGSFDWDQQYFFLEILRKSIMEYAEIPSWNPYYSGGMPVFENPLTKIPSIPLLLALVLGTVQSLKVSFILYYFSGLVGSFLLFNKGLRITPSISFMGTILFMQSGWIIEHTYPGHCNFYSNMILPWVYYFLILSIRKKEFFYMLLSGILISYLVWDGNIYFFLYTYFILFLLSCYILVTEKTLRTVGIIAVIMTIGLSFSLFRILPTLDYYLDFGFFFKPDALPLKIEEIWKIFTIRSQHPLLARNFPDQQYRWWEYGNYIGLIPFFLLPISILGMYLKNRKLLLGFMILGTLLLLLMMGKFHDLSPASLLGKIPGYTNLRSHARWSFYLVFSFTIFLGLGLQSIYEKLFLDEKEIVFSKNRIQFISFHITVILISLYLSYDLSTVNSKILRDVFPIPGSALFEKMAPESQPPFTTIYEYPGLHEFSASSMYPAIRKNISIYNGYDVLNRWQNILYLGHSDYRGEIYLIDTGSVEITHKIPSRIRIQVDSPGNNRIILNQNFNKHWTIEKSLEIANHNSPDPTKATLIPSSGKYISPQEFEKKLSIRVPPGGHEILLSYWNPFVTLGMVLGLLGLVGSYLVYYRFLTFS